MPSFDVVSEVDMAEVQNAFVQARKEISQRYDFRGSQTDVSQVENNQALELRSSSEENLKAAYKVLMERLVKRSVSLRTLDAGPIEPAGKQSYRQIVKFKQGIATDKGKEIVRLIKDSKLKVQAQIQDEQVRVTGKNRDDLQAVIALLRRSGDELGLDLQFTNFRD